MRYCVLFFPRLTMNMHPCKKAIVQHFAPDCSKSVISQTFIDSMTMTLWLQYFIDVEENISHSQKMCWTFWWKRKVGRQVQQWLHCNFVRLLRKTRKFMNIYGWNSRAKKSPGKTWQLLSSRSRRSSPMPDTHCLLARWSLWSSTRTCPLWNTDRTMHPHLSLFQRLNYAWNRLAYVIVS